MDGTRETDIHGFFIIFIRGISFQINKRKTKLMTSESRIRNFFGGFHRAFWSFSSGWLITPKLQS
jgi:hypothetical protein